MEDTRVVEAVNRKERKKKLWKYLYHTEFDELRRFEAVANQARNGLSSLLVRAIEGFNARVPPNHQILAHTPPHVVLIAEKNSFPAGLLTIRMKQDERMLICSYSYSRSPDEMPQSHNRTYTMHVGEKGIELLAEEQYIPKNEIAKEILGPFFEQVI